MKRALHALAGLLAVAALLAGCAGMQAKPAAQTYKAGSYKATAHGNLSDITVQVTFTESSIKEVKVLEQHETPMLYGAVEAKLPAAIVKSQSLAVDTVSGATNSSKAILKAVADCVRQAGGDPEALMAAKAKKAGADQEYTTDVVVIGAGASGFMAANNASMGGAKVIAISPSI